MKIINPWNNNKTIAYKNADPCIRVRWANDSCEVCAWLEWGEWMPWVRCVHDLSEVCAWLEWVEWMPWVRCVHDLSEVCAWLEWGVCMIWVRWVNDSCEVLFAAVNIPILSQVILSFASHFPTNSFRPLGFISLDVKYIIIFLSIYC